MKRIVFISFVMILFLACQEQNSKPEGVWEKERFVEVMTQMQLAESVIRLGYHRKPDSLYANDSIYDAALKAVNTNREEYDLNLTYYLDHPEQLEEVYEEVMVNLTTISAELKGNSTPVMELKK